MISKETVEEFTKVQHDALVRSKVRNSPWDYQTPRVQDAYRRSNVEAFKAIGVKVEGDSEEVRF